LATRDPHSFPTRRSSDLRTAGGPGLPGELLPVPDHVLDRQPAHDGPQMTGEDVVHTLRHQLLLVQEAAGRVGDRHEVVAHLEDEDRKSTRLNSSHVKSAY